jgi:hypothetical protein
MFNLYVEVEAGGGGRSPRAHATAKHSHHVCAQVGIAPCAVRAWASGEWLSWRLTERVVPR